jgi:hypothetical protein
MTERIIRNSDLPECRRKYLFPTQERQDKAIELVRGITAGSKRAVRDLQGAIEDRSVSVADFSFGLANSANANFVENYDEEEDWSANPQLFNKVQTTEMTNITNRRFRMSKEAAKSGRSEATPDDTLPRVDELAPFTEFGFQTGAATMRSGKWGAKFSISFEAMQNADNILNFGQEIPNAMSSFVPRTRQWAFIRNLLLLGDDTSLKAGTNVDKSVVPANARFSIDAYRQALLQIKRRKVDGRFVKVTGNQFFIFANPATADEIRYVQSVSPVQFVNGDPATGTQTRYTTSDTNPTKGLTVIESEFLPDGYWALVPYVNAVPSGRNPFTFVSFAGYDTPDLRVEDNAGKTIAGGNISPYMGSFSNDGIAYRIRMYGDFNLMNSEAMIHSTGLGV